jgi:hypothetical protein
MFACVVAASAFMNNTPLVAMMIPMLKGWCRQHQLPVAQYMMPLRYQPKAGRSDTSAGQPSDAAAATPLSNASLSDVAECKHPTSN